jgi:hypothetical protein
LLGNLHSLGIVAVHQDVPLAVAHLDLLQDYAKANVHNQAIYAQVVKDGRVVATLDNGGGVTTANGTSAPFDVNGGPDSGPALAQWRAEQIAETMGGQIVMADSAQTAATWKPPAVTQSFQAYILQQLGEAQGAGESGGASRVDTSI